MLKSVVKACAVAIVGLLCLGDPGARAWSQVPAPAPLEAYGATPAIELLQVSPSGELIAGITVTGETRALAVTRIATGESLFLQDISVLKVRDLRWIGEGRILVVTSRTLDITSLGVSRSELFFGQVVDLETRNVVQVLDRTPDVLAVLYGPASVRNTSDGDALFVRGVNVVNNQINLHRIDLRTGRGRSVAYMESATQDYVLDAEGEVIAQSRYDERSGRWSLRLPQGRNYREVWAVDAPVDSPELHGMGRTARTIVVSADRPDLLPGDAEAGIAGTLFEVNVDSGEWSRLPFTHTPDSLVHHPRTRLLVGGASNGEDGVRYEFLDPPTSARWQSIERAFRDKAPGLVSWSDALTRVVVFTDTGEAGQYQLVDFESGTADILADAYPAIAPEQVGVVRPVQYVARDGLDIPGYLTLPPGVSEPSGLPLVVLAHGGPAARDVAGFDCWAQALASRGYAVLQSNFRGSTGYGRAFLEAGYGEWGRKMQTDLSDGVRWLADQGIIDPARVCIVGASYGGYAAMAGLTLDAGVYRCGVSVNGVSDLRRMVNREARQDGRSNTQTIRYWNRFMGAARLNDRALDDLSPAHLAAEVDSPLLLIHGKDDTVVPIEQSRVMADALRRAGRPVEFVELPGEDHWLSRSATRQQMLAETVRFLEANNPVRAAD
ncbi:alpha/beta hydrolase family protein [Brevundimonas subvibrioides]|uniref:Prolyl oligopeptidase family protein n=1 Tax=Brevundimonas subvibrioides (strain ATCC 15264 / DSM 4735 / LMG 14903 / NBRC 16000 / CB 81) TaxID=633149 RepID=D9QJQ6_BRESC|nr:S9 family peptidase [Brevundimonas subvibrioides]ADK99657.1 prolyl oligopeptidase family protein [Brevundimonas subvibrioides ATCC 15264]